MRNAKSLIVVIFLFFLASAAGFGGDGNVTIVPDPIPDETVCSDGVDNDNDGLVDENDTGCVKPYRYDYSELDKRDIDATWVFEGFSTPQIDNPSVYFGSSVEKSKDRIWEIDIPRAGHQFDEQYIRNSHLEWAGGLNDSFIFDPASEVNITWSGTEFFGAELKRPPSQSDSENPLCGNAINNSGENNFNCPSDVGLPDDLPAGENTLNESQQTITEYFNGQQGLGGGNGEVDITLYSSVNPNNDGGDDIEDEFEFHSRGGDEPLEAKEYWGGKSVDLTGDGERFYYNADLENDVDAADEDTSVGDSSDYKVRIRDEEWEDNPDFYMESLPDTEIKAVYVEKKDSLSSFGSEPVTTHVLKNAEAKETYAGDPVTDKDCEEEDENATCIDDEITGCLNPSNETSYHFEDSDSEEVTLRENVQHLRTGYDRPSYDDESTSEQKEITVEVYDEPSETGYYTCSGSSTRTIDESFTCQTDGPSEGCNITTDGPTVNSSSGSTSRIAWGYEQKSVSFKYEDLRGLRETKVYDINPEQKPGLSRRADYNTIESLFFGDPYEAYIVPDDIVYKEDGENVYYSPESSEEVANSNSNSVSRSMFNIIIRGGDFLTNRTDFSTFDVDGKAEGMQFVAVDDKELGGEVIGWTPSFANSEKISGDFQGGSFVNPQDLEETGSCPHDQYYCVGTVKIGIKNIDSWESADDPEVVFSQISNEEGANESYGACRFFQYLRNQSQYDPRPLRCQYDYGSNFPGGPTPGFKPTEIPFFPTD